MAFVLEDRVVETANNPGQGDFELLGATNNNRSFVGAIGNGNTTRYLAVGAEGWEIGLAEVAAGSPDRLLRPGAVTKNSDGGTSPINFTGTVTVACIASVEDVLWRGADGDVPAAGGRDLGTAGDRWRNLFLSGVLEAATAHLASGSATGLVIERLTASINATAEFRTLGGSLWAGAANGNTFAVGPSSNLADTANRWFDATAAGLSILGQRAFHRGNILGSVGQSGGAPTGAIIERGSNANGEYVRFADGTQIAIRSAVVDLTVTDGGDFSYPAAFASVHGAFWSVSRSGLSFPGSEESAFQAGYVVGGSSAWRWRSDGTGSTTAFENVALAAIGRWF